MLLRLFQRASTQATAPEAATPPLALSLPAAKRALGAGVMGQFGLSSTPG